MTHTPHRSIVFFVQFFVKWKKYLFFRKITPTPSSIPLGVYSFHFIPNESRLFYRPVPPWFDQYGEFTGLVPVPGWSKFCIDVEQFNIKLTGVPDDIFIMSDGRFFIIDYKTAKYTGNQDKLLGMYKVQLNGYAYIFEKLGMGKIGGLGLCYYEPQGDAPTVTFETVIQKDGFLMPFKAHLKKIELDPEGVVLPLLKEVRRYNGMVEAPESREGCGDCEILGQVMGMVG